MIRVERDPAWWAAIAAHPAVVGTLLGVGPELIGALCRRDDIMPLAADHGGFMFVLRDTLGFTCELHTLFTPEGWGREVLLAGVEALHAVFLAGYQAVTTFEVRENPRSQPPRSFGFHQAGDWRETPIGELRLWVLTRKAWEASPAQRRHLCQ